ncbi:MAG: transglycosylase domain-containing protein [Candidatus Niyogibacteria bacterium]|nr:transglycosylase domain-containing protein [Candidatus Niyogibacteria bacterium]
MKHRVLRFKKFALWGGVAAIIAGGVLALWILTLDIPDFEGFSERKIVESTKIYDQTGSILLYDVHRDIQRTVVPFEEIPRHIKNATVIIEDANFYNHSGFDVSGFLRAVLVNILSGNFSQGGSTITQQLVKNALLTPEKTIDRKLKELVLALKVERTYSKEQILNFYLNEIPYGSSAYGVAAAAEIYFGKKLSGLTLAEAAYLAALPRAPTYYSPYGAHRDKLDERKDLILSRLLKKDFITQEEYDAAVKEEAKFITRGNETLKAPHFVLYVKEYLAQKYGEEMVESGGLKVTTTLDWELQQKAEDLTKQFVNEEQDKFNVYNAGLVAVDPQTGGIRVMVGSRDFWGTPLPEGCTPGADCRFEPQVNVTAYSFGRQPGSSFKPFVYATAFKKGYTPETSVFDLLTEFNPDCDPDVVKTEVLPENEQSKDPNNPCYHPKNYDEVFRGPVTLREALAQSINIPAVKVLYLSGLIDSLKTARDLGITTLTDPARYGLTLVLGGGEVKLLEMTGAYGVFANDGFRNPLTPIVKVEDARGNILEEWKSKPVQVLDTQVARQISSILSDNKARAPAFGEQSYLVIPGHTVAAKTGTTNDYHDAWVVGYVPNLAVGVWFGNNDNTAMEKRVAGFIAAPLWNAFFREALNHIEKKDFIPPTSPTVSKPVLRGDWKGGVTYTIDTISGKRATEFTPPQYRKDVPITQIHTILRWVDRNNPLGPSPVEPSRDPQYEQWEFPVRAWVAAQGIREQTEADIPQEFDDVHRPEYAPQVSFKPASPDSLARTGTLAFGLTIASNRYPVREITVMLGGRFLGTLKNTPYTFTFDLGSLADLNTIETLTIIADDSVGNRATIERTLRITD